MSDSNVSLIGPPTVEAVMTLLWGVAGRWKGIALGLGFDEDHIDEIDPNNATDEACLQDCVEQWISRLQPSWEKLSHVLRDMGEDGLAQKAWSRIGVEGNILLYLWLFLQSVYIFLGKSCSGYTWVVCLCFSLTLLLTHALLLYYRATRTCAVADTE